MRLPRMTPGATEAASAPPCPRRQRRRRAAARRAARARALAGCHGSFGPIIRLSKHSTETVRTLRALRGSSLETPCSLQRLDLLTVNGEGRAGDNAACQWLEQRWQPGVWKRIASGQSGKLDLACVHAWQSSTQTSDDLVYRPSLLTSTQSCRRFSSVYYCFRNRKNRARFPSV